MTRAATSSFATSKAGGSGLPVTSPAAWSRTPTRCASPRIAPSSSARTRGSTTTLEIIVSPEDDAEVRQLSITNNSSRARDIEVTSYAELVLAPPAADAAHPAFSKLFVQTEYVARHGALLATRRKRSPDEPDVWAAHQAVVEGEVVGRPGGRDRPGAIPRPRARSARTPSRCWTAGACPIPSVRCSTRSSPCAIRVRCAAGGTARIAFWTVVASSRAAVLDLVDRHHDANAFVRAGTLAWTQAQVQLRHLGITAVEASLFQRLAGHVLFADAALRPSSDAIRRGSGGPSGPVEPGHIRRPADRAAADRRRG